MTTDELRTTIWDNLFLEGSVKSMQELAALTKQDVFDVSMAVNHAWFHVTDDKVAIAVVAPQSTYLPN